MEKLCMDCEKPIVGRADKKFCDDQCRSNYNNRSKATDTQHIKKLNSILYKNWKILEKLNPEGKTKINRTQLEKEGFNFIYHTHVYQTQKGALYQFCYDQGFLDLENNLFLLVKQKEL